MKKIVLFRKSHVKGHTRNVGGRAIFIKEHDDKRTKAGPKAGAAAGGGKGKGPFGGRDEMHEAELAFTDKVYEALSELGDMDRSDAQGVADPHEHLISFGFEDGQTPKRVAENILAAATPKPKTSVTGYGGGGGKPGEPQYHKDKAQEFRQTAHDHGKYTPGPGKLVELNHHAAAAHDKAAETSHPDHVKAAEESGKRATEANMAQYMDDTD